jgi:hypothetical protein
MNPLTRADHVDLLIKYGAQVNAVNSENRTAIFFGKLNLSIDSPTFSIKILSFKVLPQF